MRGFIKQNVKKSLGKDGKPIVDKEGKPILIPIPNSFRIAVSLGRDPQSGKYLYVWNSIKGTKREAEKRLGQLIHEHDTGILNKPGKQTVKDYLKSWLEDTAFPNMTPRTYEGYEYNADKYIIPSIGNIHLTELKPPHIKHLCAKIQTEGHNRTAQYCYSTLKKAFNDALKMGILTRNPVDGVEKPQVVEREMQTMNEYDVNRFLERAKSTEYHSLFYTELHTGLRRGELLALRWQDTDLILCQLSINRTMHIPKYGTYKGQLIFKTPKTQKSRRLIDLTPTNTIILREHRETQERKRASIGTPILIDSDLVFCHSDGSPLLPDSVSQAWRNLVKRTGLKGIRFHDARHTHASLMLKDGAPAKVIQERLGHSSIRTTLDTYSHVAPGMQAAAVKSFDDMLNSKGNNLNRELEKLVLT